MLAIQGVHLGHILSVRMNNSSFALVNRPNVNKNNVAA